MWVRKRFSSQLWNDPSQGLVPGQHCLAAHSSRMEWDGCKKEAETGLRANSDSSEIKVSI